jgi:hypothetical protein
VVWHLISPIACCGWIMEALSPCPTDNLAWPHVVGLAGHAEWGRSLKGAVLVLWGQNARGPPKGMNEGHGNWPVFKESRTQHAMGP